MRLNTTRRRPKQSKNGYYVAVLVGVVLLAIIGLPRDDFYARNLMFSEAMLHLANSPVQSSSSSQEFDLAYTQSFGFFDDIPNENWLRAQEIHAKLFPNHNKNLKQFSNAPKVRDKTTELKYSSHWNSQNFHEEFHCAYAQRLPTDGSPDGPKWVCDPHRLRKKKDCLVYSVGSNGKAEFEQGIRDEIGDNCEIHTFDYNSYNRRNGHFEKALEGLATFHHWGLGTEKVASKSPTRFKTLSQTMQELGHVNRTIDIFKIDCEWCEWFTYDSWLKQDLRQILVETHNAPMPNAKDFFYSLHDAGYVIFNKEPNLVNKGGGIEFGFIKLSPDFFVNGSTYRNLA
eukprot:scaffold4642_cov112-Cylindrotheca_fusiformis.AAC.2